MGGARARCVRLKVRERGGWEHVHISDSLVMADAAVAMAESGCAAVCVLGVDFMSENVRAILDGAGFAHVPVLRIQVVVSTWSLLR